MHERGRGSARNGRVEEDKMEGLKGGEKTEDGMYRERERTVSAGTRDVPKWGRGSQLGTEG